MDLYRGDGKRAKKKSHTYANTYIHLQFEAHIHIKSTYIDVCKYIRKKTTVCVQNI